MNRSSWLIELECCFFVPKYLVMFQTRPVFHFFDFPLYFFENNFFQKYFFKISIFRDFWDKKTFFWIFRPKIKILKYWLLKFYNKAPSLKISERYLKKWLSSILFKFKIHSFEKIATKV